MSSRTVTKARFAMCFLLLFLSIGIGLTQAMEPVPSGQFPHFKMLAGQMDQDGVPTSGAKVCVLAPQKACYQMQPHTLSGTDPLTYEFGLEPHNERLQLTNGGSWVFFTSMFSGGGSGTLTCFAILRYDSATDRIVNLLPYVAATNVSDYAMWSISSASPYPVLVHADFVWSEGESHFGQHFYQVEVWKFDSSADSYKKVFDYRTSKKYDGGDAAPVRVLKFERPEILRRLSQN